MGQPWGVGDNLECRCANQAHLQFLPPVACQARFPGEFFFLFGARPSFAMTWSRACEGPVRIL